MQIYKKRNMKHILFSLCIVCLSDRIHSVEINVIGNITDGNDFGCNTQVILQCIVNPQTDPVLWHVGKPVTPATALAAQCSQFACAINPTVSSLYDFSYNETSGESNMTIKDVTLSEDAKEYKCDDGSAHLIFKSVVQVPPVNETTQISNTTLAGMANITMVTVSTGCVTNKTAKLVTFKWYWYKKNEYDSAAVYIDATPPSSSDDSPCQINSDCITNGSVALSNNFTITEDATAPEVYFEVHILLDGSFLFSVNTTSTFRPNSVITSSPSSAPVKDGCINTCDCDIKDLIIVIVVAWASAIILTFVGSCILKYSLNKADLHECIFKLGSLPSIFLLVVVILYKGDKKRGLIPFVISFVLDAVFIGIDRYYVCLCENVCDIELLDHLWASFVYLMVCAVLSVLKYIILEKCCDSDSSVSNSNLDLKQSDVEDKHEQRGARPLPPMTNVSSRPGNEKEHAHSLTHVKITHRSPLPPISPKKNS